MDAHNSYNICCFKTRKIFRVSNCVFAILKVRVHTTKQWFKTIGKNLYFNNDVVLDFVTILVEHLHCIRKKNASNTCDFDRGVVQVFNRNEKI